MDPVNPEYRKSGTIPVVSFPEDRPLWHKFVLGGLVLVVLASLAWKFWPGGSSEGGGDPRQQARELAANRPREAIALARERLGASKDKKDQIYWHDFLAGTYLKIKDKEQARTHLVWLVRTVPGEARYRKMLKGLTHKKK